MTTRMNETFSAKENGEEQKAIRLQAQVFKCDQCPKTYNLKDSFRKHIKYVHMKHQKELRFTCELCQKKFTGYCHLEEHINAHLGLKPYKCGVCWKRFIQKCHLNTHMQTTHAAEERKRNWKCSKCNKTYFQKCDLETHFKAMHEGVRYSCLTCSASFKRKSHLKGHQLIHSGDRPFQCKKCPDKFRQLANLNSHVMRKHIGKTAKTHKCNYCSKTFFTRQDLERHLVVHTNDSRFSCAICTKAFGNRSILENHMRSHTMERPYKCIKCPMAFTRQSNLTRHQICKHDSRGNAFTCIFCNLKCGSKYNLQDHYLRHVQEKPYSCRRCPKAFCTRGDLKRHSRTHTTTTK